MYTDTQIEKYLNRIRYAGTPDVSVGTLDDLIYAHQCSVPFENLDVYDFHREIRLDEDSLFEKLVNRNRGGYCFETNGLFYHMIRAMGFDARPCLCRVMFGLQYPEENLIDHRGTIVYLDGKRYFCEAGIGGAMPAGALLLPDTEDSGTQKRNGTHPEGTWQNMRGEFFCVRTIEQGWYGTIRRVKLSEDIYDDPMDRQERLEIMFCDAAVHEADFAALNYYLSRSDRSGFRHRRIVNIRTPKGYRALTNLTYREVILGMRSEQILSAKEIPAILKEKFGIYLSPLETVIISSQ